ncbi:MAG: hypothetical protein GOMPHAMPRED_005125 [Gomphillus americanus]|uniref:Uncharacterized protein n=1 Tax=Gomphillus americanus TaxID=1940652 RepID=A0A8H3EIU6_9LECA|nr:MAG: hypothetical protein GOMPHAMPRED_005125 [Gomphillus americanus]
MARDKLDPVPFFSNWSGHPVSDLSVAFEAVQNVRSSQSIVYFAGDSSLDNKAWVPSYDSSSQETVPAIYGSFLEPAHPKPDVAYWLNYHLGEKATCLNAAVEASLLRHRDGGLLPQDEFIHDHIRSQDVLIVSVGANDIALSPNIATMFQMVRLTRLTSRKSLEDGSAGSLQYFKWLFGNQVQSYISRLVAKQKPRAIIVCMIYFPLEEEQKGWASLQLKLLGYNQNPGQLQIAIRKIFEQATMQIEIEGTEVLPCALFEALDGKTRTDYVERVEPSVEGGDKMARRFHNLLEPILKIPTKAGKNQ